MATPCTYRNEDRQLYVAYWFDRLARHLLKSKPITFEKWMDEKGLGRYDLYSESLYSCVEIKGSSNMDQMKLFSDQLDGQLKELGFPFDNGFVWIFSYRNFQQIQNIRSRMLKQNGKTPEEVSRFLAANTTVAYAVDIHLLKELRGRNGTRPYTRDKLRDRKIISINRTQLHEVADSARSELCDLGFGGQIGRWLPPNAKRLRHRFVKAKIDGEPVNFELVLLLPNEMKRRLLKQINGTIRRE